MCGPPGPPGGWKPAPGPGCPGGPGGWKAGPGPGCPPGGPGGGCPPGPGGRCSHCSCCCATAANVSPKVAANEIATANRKVFRIMSDPFSGAADRARPVHSDGVGPISDK